MRKNKTTDDYGVIYAIANILTNRAYIGSTISYPNRIYNHFKRLMAGEHTCVALQEEFDKYGIEAFHAFVLEKVCEKDAHVLTKIELGYIRKAANPYNSSPSKVSSIHKTKNFKRVVSIRSNIFNSIQA